MTTVCSKIWKASPQHCLHCLLYQSYSFILVFALSSPNPSLQALYLTLYTLFHHFRDCYLWINLKKTLRQSFLGFQIWSSEFPHGQLCKKDVDGGGGGGRRQLNERALFSLHVIIYAAMHWKPILLTPETCTLLRPLWKWPNGSIYSAQHLQ